MTNTERTNLDGTPDMRFKSNRQAEFAHMKAQVLLLESKVTKLNDMLREKRLTEKPAKVKPATCCICMEESAMQKGQAKLDCGHTYCISCFTQHARNSNKCPLCRDSFAPEPKKAAVQENSSFDLEHALQLCMRTPSMTDAELRMDRYFNELRRVNAMVNLTLDHNPNSSEVSYTARRDIKSGEDLMYLSETGHIEDWDLGWDTDIEAGQCLEE